MLRICVERMYEISELKWEGKKRRLAVCKRDRINRRKVQGIRYLLFFAVFFIWFCLSSYQFIQTPSIFSWTWIKQIIITYSNSFAPYFIEKGDRFKGELIFWFLSFSMVSHNLAWKRQKFPNNTVLYTELFHVSLFWLDLYRLSIKLSRSACVRIYSKKSPCLSLKSIVLPNHLKTFKDSRRLKMS